MQFVDANAGIGRDLNRHSVMNHERFTMSEYVQCAGDAAQLIENMDQCGIERAVVWCRSMYDLAPDAGNRQMVKELKTHEDRLIGSWTILPGITDKEFEAETLLKEMRSHGIQCLRAFPHQNRYLLNQVTMGEQLEAFEALRIPLYLTIRDGFEYIYAVLKEFPKLTVVISDTGCWSSSRYIYPLLKKYENVYYETGGFQEVRGYEQACAQLGCEKLLFGTDFPTNSMGCAKAALLMANITDESKEQIASGNMIRLLEGIKL
jgi:predicted TIM-barrel fold metal-dependent hydrolase